MLGRLKRNNPLGSILVAVSSIILGLTVAGFLILAAGTNPIDAYQRLFCEGFGAGDCQTFGDLLFQQVETESGDVQTVFSPLYGVGGNGLSLVLERATPLILTALAATVVFKSGMFSIGMDGQYVLGAVTVAFLGVWLPRQIYLLAGFPEGYDTAPESLRTAMHIIVPILCVSAAMAVGAFYSWIGGILKVKLNVNELISSIILNAIAIRIMGYLVNFPLRSDSNNVARTERIDDTAWLIPFNRGIFADVEWFSGARVGVGLILAILAIIFVGYYLYRTTAGYEQRMTRGSRLFARYSGIASGRAVLRAMLISGALSGLAGAIDVLGVERRVVDGFAVRGTGFDGVLIAILARESLLGILFFAPFIAGLDLGSVNLQFGNIPRQLGGMIVAFIILFNAMEDFLRTRFGAITGWFQRRRRQPPPIPMETRT